MRILMSQIKCDLYSEKPQKFLAKEGKGLAYSDIWIWTLSLNCLKRGGNLTVHRLFHRIDKLGFVKLN